MESLEDLIDDHLGELRKTGATAAFVKLSTRSPKDVTIYGTASSLTFLRVLTTSADFENVDLQKAIMEEVRAGPDQSDVNIVWGFIKGTSRLLKVTSGKEAVSVRGSVPLLICHS